MDFVALAQECAPQVAHETLAAIVRTENSAFQPLAIGVNGGAWLARQPRNKAEAVVTAKWLIANGYNIDLGLGQINSANLGKVGLTVEDAFDPCENLAAAATILHGNYQAASRKLAGEQAALHAALSAYNTGSFTRGIANGYVWKVVNNAGPAKAVPVIAPIPVLVAPAPRTAARPAASPRPAQAGEAKPQAEGRQEAEGDGASVYGGGGSTRSVMVY
jgi:type IV secretion system protein VirB1